MSKPDTERKPPNVMIDLETMSTAKTAAILSIGAVQFDFKTGELGAEFYQNITLSSCAFMGMHRSADTLNWWSLDENKEARDALSKDAVSIEMAIIRFIQWCGGEIIPWGNGVAFDIVILENAIRLFRREPPWKFYNESCYRTIKRLFRDVVVPRQGTKHHALDDAKHQARHLMAIMDTITISNLTEEHRWREQV